jgi:hypothetical protein
MDDEAQMLRSAVSDALQCARVVQQHRRGNDSSDADDASTTSVQNDDDTRELSLALETAVGAIRQVVYGVLAGVDGPESTSAAKNTTTTVAEIVKMSRRASAVKKVDSLQPKPLTVSTRRSLFRKSTSVVTGMKVPGAGDDSDSEEHDRDSDDDDDVGDDDDDGGAESEATNGNRSASGADLRKSAHRTTGSAVSAAALNPSRVAPPFSDDDSAALSTIDLLPVEVMMVMGREMTKRTARYRREETSTRAPQLAVMLEKNNTAIGFYSKHFLTTGVASSAGGERPHLNLIAVVKDKKYGPYAVVSIRRSPELTSESGERDQHLAIVRTKGADELVFVACPGAKEKDLIKAVRDGLPYLAKADITPVHQPEFVTELADYEEKNLLRSYKFGVLVLSVDNKTADESGLYGWRGPHEGVERFLGLMSRRVRLKGWRHYKGGLDARTDTTGTHSWYTRYCGAEIMFHVAHEIPYTEGDMQQVERKRHIGNDIVVIVFREHGAPPFDPETIKSHFNHIFLVVSPVKALSGTPHYRIEMLTNESLRSYGPKFKDPPIYRHSTAFGNMLLAKMINGERAAYASPTFAQKFKRTRRELLELLCEKRLKAH